MSRPDDVASMLLAGPLGAALRRPLPADQIPEEVSSAFALVFPGHDAIRPVGIGLFDGQVKGWQVVFHGTSVNVDTSTTDPHWFVSTPCMSDYIRGNNLPALLREARAQTAAAMARDAKEKAEEAREIAEDAALWGAP